MMLLLLVIAILSVSNAGAYSASRDRQIIADFRRGVETDHAKVARKLVHNANWASVGTISTNEDVKDYPMVNIISIDDGNATQPSKSTGIIHFLLTDLDFTGPDWQRNNKVTFLFTDEQTLSCKNSNKDPMEPTCARVMISGRVKKVPTDSSRYQSELNTFIARHPAAPKWIKTHNFYLCELTIENIFVLDFYGGPHKVNPSDYYAVNLET